MVKNREGFVAACFLARVIIALGTAIANTASLAVLTEKFNSHLSAVFVSFVYYFINLWGVGPGNVWSAGAEHRICSERGTLEGVGALKR